MDRLQELRHKAKTDLFWLATDVLGYDFVEDVHRGLFASYVQKDPARSLSEQDSVKNRLRLWPRGHYKSTANIADAVQWILNFPNIRIAYGHGVKAQGKLYLAAIKGHFEGNAKLKKLFPEFCADSLGTKSEFTVPCRTRSVKEPTAMLVSEKSVKAGLHFDLGYFDDLVHENNYRNPDLLQKTIDDFQHYHALIDEGGYKEVSGTPYSPDDLYAWIKTHNDGTWSISSRTCWIDTPEGKKVLFPQRQSKDGRTIGFTVESLEAKRQDNPEFFSYQYECNPVPKVMQHFTEEMISRQTIAYRDIPARGPKVMIIDVAVSDRKSADDSVIGIAQISDGKMFVIDTLGGQWQPHDLIRNICFMLLKWRPIKVYIERCGQTELIVPGLEAFASANNITGIPLEWIRAKSEKGYKDQKISTAQTFFKQGRLWLALGLPGYDKIVQQLLKRGRHNDWADMLGILCVAPTGIQNVNPVRKVPNYILNPISNTPDFLKPVSEPEWPGLSVGLTG